MYQSILACYIFYFYNIYYLNTKKQKIKINRTRKETYSTPKEIQKQQSLDEETNGPTK
jgi:hypothetical protein